MLTSEYLRRQAEACLRIARVTFDLTTAERLRHMAAELHGKADEYEDREADRNDDAVEPHMMTGNGMSRNGSSDSEHG